MENCMNIVQRVLNQAIKDAYYSIENLTKDIVTLQDRMATEHRVIIEAKKALQDMCPHPSASKHNEKYVSGGYDHVSETSYDLLCDECGFSLGSKLIQGTYA